MSRSLGTVGWCALCACLGAVTVTAFSRGGAPSAQAISRSVAASSDSDRVAFISVKGASPGGYASVTIQASPGTECSIQYVTPHGTVSRAKGLESQTTDSDGQASWTWKIGTHTEPGTGSVAVACNGESATTPIEIGQ
jgi:hypothetical protein